jgi:hypothetical protein
LQSLLHRMQQQLPGEIGGTLLTQGWDHAGFGKPGHGGFGKDHQGRVHR